jgi:hypothetical protein
MRRPPYLIYRIEGGYFSMPRWTSFVGRAIWRERSRRSTHAGELAAMTNEEVDRLIAEHLVADGYAYEAAHPCTPKCPRRAESLEAALYLCRACGGGRLRFIQRATGSPARLAALSWFSTSR